MKYSIGDEKRVKELKSFIITTSLKLISLIKFPLCGKVNKH